MLDSDNINKQEYPLGFENRRVQDNVVISILKEIDAHRQHQHEENKRKITSWVQANAISVIALILSIIWGVMKLSNVTGELRQSLIDIDVRVQRIERMQDGAAR